jgi:hypothetical protein
MRIQGVKLMTMLTVIVYNLHLPGQVLPAVNGNSDTASSPPITTRLRTRCCGPWNRCLRKTSRRQSTTRSAIGELAGEMKEGRER